jgi:hypothetical protein
VHSAADLLATWERGHRATPGQRGLLLLSLAEPGESRERLSAWTVGERDAALLRLRERLFGPRATGLAICEQCGEPLEFAFDVSSVRRPVAQDAPGDLTVKAGAHVVGLRAPSAGDLAALADAGTPAPDRWLLERCIVDAREGDAPCEARDLPTDVVQEAAAAIAAVVPEADVDVSLTCPACGGSCVCAFDVVSFLWLELDAWALQMLDEVYALASAFGWSEADILSLGPARRRAYMELIEA